MSECFNFTMIKLKTKFDLMVNKTDTHAFPK